MLDERSSQLSAFARRIAGRHQKAAHRGGLEGAFELSDAGGFEALAADDREREVVARAHRKLLEDEPLAPEEASLYEAIVLPYDRPALFVRGGTYDHPPAPWTHLDEEAPRLRLKPAIAAVGRVELSPPGEVPYVGTAFVVGAGLLMTNRHVAAAFARGRGVHARFIDGRGASVHFAREAEATNGEHGSPRSTARNYPVAHVVMMHPYWDMALLHVPELPTEPLHLEPAAPEDLAGRAVAVVGHPARDSRNPYDVQDRVFERKYQVKRLQPGYVIGRALYSSAAGVRETLAHDSSTLGGNSGSAVVSVETGDVIGLHFAGKYRVANYAVPAFELARDPRVAAAGVTFARGGPTPDDPWERDWREVPQTAPAPRVGRAVIVRIPIEISVRVGDPTRDVV